MDHYREGLEHKARAFSGSDRGHTYCEGVILGYCDAPTYTIRRQDGTSFTWRCDLTEVYDEVVPVNKQPPVARMGGHYILYENVIVGTSVTEAVCFCGALLRSGGVLYGSIGEMFSAHIRSARREEEKRMNS